MRTFRVHHILCTNLYQGRGYSGDFCKNMTEVVNGLREHPETLLELVCEPDMICANCPNLTEEGGCMQDDNHVGMKDELLRQKLQLKEHGSYSYRGLCQTAYERLTERDFTQSCGNCEWYRQGLCDYQTMRENLRKISAFSD